MSTNPSPKTTQTIHPLPTPAGPVELTVNYETERVAVPSEIPFTHLRVVIFGLNEIDKEWQKRKKRVSTTRKREDDNQTD